MFHIKSDDTPINQGVNMMVVDLLYWAYEI